MKVVQIMNRWTTVSNKHKKSTGLHSALRAEIGYGDVTKV